MRGAILAALVMAVVAPALAAQRPRPRRAARPGPTGCAVSPARWAAIDDDQWPLIAHRDSDQAWAHLEPDSLPRATASWCNPLESNAAALAAGRSIYARHCETCHGAAGKAAASDLTAPMFAGMRVPPGPAVLYAIVTRGIAGTAMRAFGPDLGPWERLAVLACVTRFPGDSAIKDRKAWSDSLQARRSHGH